MSRAVELVTVTLATGTIVTCPAALAVKLAVAPEVAEVPADSEVIPEAPTEVPEVIPEAPTEVPEVIPEAPTEVPAKAPSKAAAKATNK